MTDTETKLLKELKVARTAIRKMKAESKEYDEVYEIGKVAMTRINNVINEFRQPIAISQEA